jgi:ribosomal protein S18 acetylase RimI-like enzyme
MWEDLLSETGTAQFPVFVATDNGRIVGFCSFGAAEGDSGGAGEVYAIYLLPEYLGKGAGHALFDAALTALKHAGFQQAVLWVLEGNDRAVRFYEAHGWASDGARKETERGGVVTRELRYRTAITHSA